jgi:purine-binding chemotaxis protein CheW
MGPAEVKRPPAVQKSGWVSGVEEKDREMLFVFLRGEQTYAIPPTSVAEVLGHQGVTPVPFSPSWIEGVVGVRGDVVPVLNLEAYFGLERLAAESLPRLVVLHHESHTLAVWADRILGVEGVDRTALEPPLGNLPEAMAKVCRAHFRMGESIVNCLDLDLLLSETKQRVAAG